jgi:hypothetical protein
MKGPNSFLVVVIMVSLIAIGSACGGRSKRPADVLSKKEMIMLLSEIYIAEGKISRLGVSPDSAQKLYKVFREMVNERTGVSDSVFQRSFRYYRDRPKDMELIYSALVDSLNLREQRSLVK